MTRLTLAAATLAIGVLTAGSAIAGQCPSVVKAIDAAMASNSSLSQAQMDDAKALRDEGAALHKAGKHGESLSTLAKAKAIVGI